MFFLNVVYTVFWVCIFCMFLFVFATHIYCILCHPPNKLCVWANATHIFSHRFDIGATSATQNYVCGFLWFWFWATCAGLYVVWICLYNMIATVMYGVLYCVSILMDYCVLCFFLINVFAHFGFKLCSVCFCACWFFASMLPIIRFCYLL